MDAIRNRLKAAASYPFFSGGFTELAANQLVVIPACVVKVTKYIILCIFLITFAEIEGDLRNSIA